ncbi:DUF7261 family protein [Halorubellus salinus]|uniref:DUF7261 family protein n=1 Tax=Halorubellus salinus TaxID=755309 RepID=UPI001D089C88|nr:hypothetical protein [Halorubellus salinus]
MRRLHASSGGVDAGRDRGQLVLAAAGVVAVALLAMTAAYLQLGAHPDVAAERDVGPREAIDRAVGVLSRAVDDARVTHTGEAWGDRETVVDAVRSDLATALDSLETARVARGTAYAVDYDQAAASAYASEHCPGGDGRAFGDCEAIEGVVVQERAGETTVLAVAFEVTVTTPDGETTVEVVV